MVCNCVCQSVQCVKRVLTPDFSVLTTLSCSLPACLSSCLYSLQSLVEGAEHVCGLCLSVEVLLLWVHGFDSLLIVMATSQQMFYHLAVGKH